MSLRNPGTDQNRFLFMCQCCSLCFLFLGIGKYDEWIRLSFFPVLSVPVTVGIQTNVQILIAALLDFNRLWKVSCSVKRFKKESQTSFLLFFIWATNLTPLPPSSSSSSCWCLVRLLLIGWSSILGFVFGRVEAAWERGKRTGGAGGALWVRCCCHGDGGGHVGRREVVGWGHGEMEGRRRTW